MRRRYFDGPHGQLHARTSGESGPWLVLLHESPLSSFVYEPSMDLLGADFRAVAVDTPGYGMSDAPLQALDIPTYASRILETLRPTFGDEPVAVAGIHTGASLAVEFARLGGEQVTHLTMMGLPAYDEVKRADMLTNWARDIPLARDGSHLAVLWERYATIWKQAPVELHHAAVVAFASVLPRYNWCYNAVFRHDPVPSLRAVGAARQFIVAELDPLAAIDLRLAEELDARVDHVPGIGGQIAYRRPDALAELMRDFVLG